MITFDTPVIFMQNCAFEDRYAFLLKTVNSDHPFAISCHYQERKGEGEREENGGDVREEGREGGRGREERDREWRGKERGKERRRVERREEGEWRIIFLLQFVNCCCKIFL